MCIQKLTLNGNQKYLLFFSYIGTKFKGLQRQVSRKSNKKYTNDNTIQFALEEALNNLRPKSLDDVVISLSSRTDKHVHAFMNSCHFNLLHPQNQVYLPSHIINSLNSYFRENQYEISANKIYLVSPDFYSREQVKWRRYYFRLGILKNTSLVNSGINNSFLVPVSELYRCSIYTCPDKLNIGNMIKTAEAFKGTHDFTAFEAPNFRLTYRDNFCLKTIDEFEINQEPLDLFEMIDSNYKNINIFNITVKSKSFLYRQVRRMVGCIIMTGFGILKVEEVKNMLRDPKNNPWHPSMITASPYGLYLSHLEYDPKDFLNPIRSSSEIFEDETDDEEEENLEKDKWNIDVCS